MRQSKTKVSNKNKMSLTRCFTAVAAPLRAIVLISFISRHSCVARPVLCVRAACSATSATAPRSNEHRKMYIAEERGSPYAPDYRVYFSEFLDIQLAKRLCICVSIAGSLQQLAARERSPDSSGTRDSISSACVITAHESRSGFGCP